MSRKLPTYSAIATALKNCFIPSDAAEIHGLITGILAVTHNLSASISGLQNLMSIAQPEDEDGRKGFEMLKSLCALTALQLEDHNFDFHLLLPDDDTSLALRTEAIGTWCQGFLSGLGEAGLSLKSSPNIELAEIINDLSAIGQVDTSALDDSEEEEVAYHELMEYVRVVVMTIYTDVGHQTSATDTAAKTVLPNSKTIH